MSEEREGEYFRSLRFPPLLPTQTYLLHTFWVLSAAEGRGVKARSKKSQLQLGKATAEEEEEVETGKTAGE